MFNHCSIFSVLCLEETWWNCPLILAWNCWIYHKNVCFPLLLSSVLWSARTDYIIIGRCNNTTCFLSLWFTVIMLKYNDHHNKLRNCFGKNTKFCHNTSRNTSKILLQEPENKFFCKCSEFLFFCLQRSHLWRCGLQT